MWEQPSETAWPGRRNCTSGPDPAAVVIRIKVCLLYCTGKAGFRVETGPAGMRMPRGQVTTITIKPNPRRTGSQWEAESKGNLIETRACVWETEEYEKALSARHQVARGYSGGSRVYSLPHGGEIPRAAHQPSPQRRRISPAAAAGV